MFDFEDDAELVIVVVREDIVIIVVVISHERFSLIFEAKFEAKKT